MRAMQRAASQKWPPKYRCFLAFAFTGMPMSCPDAFPCYAGWPTALFALEFMACRFPAILLFAHQILL